MGSAFVVWSFVFLILIVKAMGKRTKKFELPDDGSFDGNYLYLKNSGLVVDFHPESESNPSKPSFIFGTDKGPRLVEFYAPWCPHCRKFRNHYIELAEKLSTVAHDDGAPTISFHAVSCKVHKDLCSSMGINGYPQLIAFPAHSNQGKGLNFGELHPSLILNSLEVQVDQLQVDAAFADEDPTIMERLEDGLMSWLPQDPIPTVRYPRTKQDVFDDAYRAFQFSLREGVYTTNGALGPQKRKALKEWLHLLSNCLPVQWKIQTLINALLNEFDSICSGREHLEKVLDRFPLPGSWSSACEKGEKGMGYTCGLWELFHIMSIGLVEWNEMLPNDPNKRLAIGADHAGDTMRNFVEFFFTCEQCRKNFLKEYDGCALDRCSRLTYRRTKSGWIKFSQWLFEFHNTVNARLSREQAEQEKRTISKSQEIASQWPSRYACAKCYQADGTWQLDNVYKFLRIEYWPEDAKSEELRKELKLGHGLSTQRRLMATASLSPLIVLWGAVLLGLSGLALIRKVSKDRSGYHKKSDEV